MIDVLAMLVAGTLRAGQRRLEDLGFTQSTGHRNVLCRFLFLLNSNPLYCSTIFSSISIVAFGQAVRYGGLGRGHGRYTTLGFLVFHGQRGLHQRVDDRGRCWYQSAVLGQEVEVLPLVTR